MKIGIIPYTNCLPLIHGMEVSFQSMAPSKLLQKNDLDIFLAPIVAAFLDPNLFLIDEMGIGCLGAVETVKLFFKNPSTTPYNIERIYLDPESQTSIALLKLLLTFHYQRDLNQFSFSETLDAETEGLLLIGDKVWEQSKTQKAIDLGSVWYQWTRRPFVFACWMTRSPTIAKKWKPILLKHKEQNLKNLETLAKNFPSKSERLLRYWRTLSYELGAPQKEAILFFQKEWAKLENQPVHPLNWV